MTTGLGYHLGEFAIQADPDDPRNILPPIPRSAARILDLGCGIGQTLAATGAIARSLACGLDIDHEAVRYGASANPAVRFVCGAGETLPFASCAFDFVYARVTLPWVHIPSALSEIARVLVPGGSLWCSLVAPKTALRDFTRAIRERRSRNAVYRAYVLANGALFYATGRQFRFPLKRSRCESFQTVRGMRLALERAGLTLTSAEQGRFFVVTASRPYASGGSPWSIKSRCARTFKTNEIKPTSDTRTP